MSESDRGLEENAGSSLPQGYRLKPSRNQKQRSKLKQAAEEPAPPSEPEPEPEPPQIHLPDSGPLVRKYRIKRSGQMHDDLTGPMPEGDTPPRKEPEY